jgi:hypothetical protein
MALLLPLLTLATAAAHPPHHHPTSVKPHILFVVCDDLGCVSRAVGGFVVNLATTESLRARVGPLLTSPQLILFECAWFL